MFSVKMSSAQQRRAQLLGKSKGCCSLWCSTFSFTITWSVMNVIPFIFAAVLISILDSADLMIQDPDTESWCNIYDYNPDTDSYYWYEDWDHTYYGKCGQLMPQFAMMLVFSLSYDNNYFYNNIYFR